MKNIGIYVVSIVVSYEGPVAQHVFPSEPPALAAFDKLAASARAGQLEYGASVVLSGPPRQARRPSRRLGRAQEQMRRGLRAGEAFHLQYHSAPNTARISSAL
jgi:hypothetical protein